MTAIALRKKLHKLIDKVEEKKLKVIYSLVENEIEHDESFYTMLNERYEEYKKAGKAISRKESQTRVKKLLRSIK